MKTFTGYEYLLIDVASQFGLDKLRFEDRIQWAVDHLADLEALATEADSKTRPLYIKAVQALRKAQAGEATGHLVGMDAVCSGVQIMSVITGCEAGAKATGLIDEDRRPDAYSDVTAAMNDALGGTVEVSRKDAKAATMTSFYGSKRTPEDIFGKDTEELVAFHTAAHQVAPGAWQLLQVLLAAWQPFALEHNWRLPDGYWAHVKVMEKHEARIEVDELDHATFTYEYYDNMGSKTGKSLAANVTHSIDAYVLRNMHRRCNYDHVVVRAADVAIIETLAFRNVHGILARSVTPGTKIAYYLEQWERSGMADPVILPYLTSDNCDELPTELLEALARITVGMLQYKPFPIVAIHDEFKCHANNVNWMRWQYKEILADLAESHILTDILSQIYGVPGRWTKLSKNLGAKIRNSNYAIC
jgi:hypothetical protein